MGRVWCAGGTHIQAALSAHGGPGNAGGTIVLEIVAPDGAALGAARAQPGHSVQLAVAAAARGFYTLRVSGTNLPDSGAPFHVEVDYQGSTQIH